ncbi:unnamed protein product [Rotaria socialis]|uniref:HTTM domain-containing protein n=2 Tax=Rotaria socialis TaxID=392032 RepID=A0A818MPX8_9BILA|nr:unnamed protein product [Rotaria socialis]
MNHIATFFMCDGPVISDLIRIIIYAYLLFDCFMGKITAPPIGDTPLQAHVLLQKTNPLFWSINNKFSRYFLFLHRYEYLKIIIRIAKISWICCIVGLGGFITRSITGISVFILSTSIIGIGKIGVRHRWHVPTWTLLALIFTKFKTNSVDHLITTYINSRYNAEPNQIIFDSGFSSKFIQCISLYTLFAAGISKLRNSGIQWILPGTLTFYLSDPTLDNFTVMSKFRKDLRRLILQYPLIIIMISGSSLIFELISIFALFFPSIRLIIVIFAWAFHFGILLLLSPNYLPQCVCYLMIIDIPCHTKIYQTNMNINYVDIFVIVTAIMIIVGYLLSLIYCYEGWPFTSVPMYALDRRQFTHDYLIDENQLNYLGNELHLLNGISVGCNDQFSFGETWIRITKNDGNMNIIKQICFHMCPFEYAFRHSLLSALIRSIVISKHEMDIFILNIFDILAADDLQFITKNEFISVEIHFKDGWKTYSTSKRIKEH